MVKAELSYNPYLQETDIKFNGQSPRINSHVEKYMDKKLQIWIKKIPRIFKDEMNGYGFNLEFSGTELDLNELRKSFADAGVSDEQVHIFHKNELDERDEKLKQMSQMYFEPGLSAALCPEATHLRSARFSAGVIGTLDS